MTKPKHVQVAWWPRDAGETSAPWVMALVRALRCPAPLAYGYTAFLASYTATHWPSGRIPADTTDETLADAAGLPIEADSGVFVRALDASGWWVLEADGTRVVPQVAQAFDDLASAREAARNKKAQQRSLSPHCPEGQPRDKAGSPPIVPASSSLVPASPGHEEGEGEREGEDPPPSRVSAHEAAQAPDDGSQAPRPEPAPRARQSAGAAALNRLRGGEVPAGLGDDEAEALAQAGVAFGRPDPRRGGFLAVVRALVGGADGEAFALLDAMPANRQADQVLGACLRAQARGKGSLDFVRGVLVRALLEREDLASVADAPRGRAMPQAPAKPGKYAAKTAAVAALWGGS